MLFLAVPAVVFFAVESSKPSNISIPKKEEDYIRKAYPITFGIPEVNVLPLDRSKKTQLWSSSDPRKKNNAQQFTTEESYMHNYSISWYAYTKVKGGWDCMRHLEILAAGCIPVIDLDGCPEKTMMAYPKEILTEIFVNHESVDDDQRWKWTVKLREHFLKKLTCRRVAQHLLNTVDPNAKKVLFIDHNFTVESGGKGDYTPSTIYTGLKFLRNIECESYFPMDILYEDWNYAQSEYYLYGNGFNYKKVIPVSRRQKKYDTIDELEEKLKNHEYDLVIYGSWQRSMKEYDLVRKYYNGAEIIACVGEDNPELLRFDNVPGPRTYFIRELGWLDVAPHIKIM